MAFFASRTVLDSESPMVRACCSAVNLVSASVTLLVLACSATAPKPVHVSSPAPNASIVSLTPLTATTLTHRTASAQSLSIALPEANLWQTGNQGTYYHAVHSETASELWVKRWRQGEVVSSNQCAAQSALWRPDLVPPNGEPSETLRNEETLDVPSTYHTQVGVQVWPAGDFWHGQLTASGAAIRECFAYVYRSRAPRSPLGRAVVNQRLSAMRQALAATRVIGATVDAKRETTP